jgi:hypothetical protein
MALAVRGSGQIAELRRVEVVRILRETGRGRVLDALIDRQDREVARSPETPVAVELS